MSFGFYVAMAFVLNLVAGNDHQFTGCFLYLGDNSNIQEGWYEPRNLSPATCSRDCQSKYDIHSFFALARRSLCLCDNNVENFEVKGRVEDERCHSHCFNSSDNTEYCGNNGTLALYTVNPLSKCYNLSELTNGIIRFKNTQVDFECDKGYVISDNNSLTCQRKNGSWNWSGPEPHCQEEDQSTQTFAIVLGVTTILLIAFGIVVGVLGFLYKRGNSVRLCSSPFSSYRRGSLPRVTVQTNTVVYSNERILQRPPPVPPRQLKNSIQTDLLGTLPSQVKSELSSDVENIKSKDKKDNVSDSCGKDPEEIRTSSNYVRPNSHHENSSITEGDEEYEWSVQLCKNSDEYHEHGMDVWLKPSTAPRLNKMNYNLSVPPKYTRVKKGKDRNRTSAFTSTEEKDKESDSQVYLDVL